MRALHTEIDVECFVLPSSDKHLPLLNAEEAREFCQHFNHEGQFKLPAGSWQGSFHTLLKLIIENFRNENEPFLIKAKTLDQAYFSIIIWWRLHKYGRFFKLSNDETLTTAIILHNECNGDLEGPLSLMIYIQIDNNKCDYQRTFLEIKNQPCFSS